MSTVSAGPQPRPHSGTSRAGCGHHHLPGTPPRGLQAPSQGPRGPWLHTQDLTTPHCGQAQTSQQGSPHLLTAGVHTETETHPPTPSATRRLCRETAQVCKRAKKPLPPQLANRGSAAKVPLRLCTDVCTHVHVLRACIQGVHTCVCMRASSCPGLRKAGGLLAAGTDSLWTVGRTVWSRASESQCHQPRTAPCWAWGCPGSTAVVSEQVISAQWTPRAELLAKDTQAVTEVSVSASHQTSGRGLQ